MTRADMNTGPRMPAAWKRRGPIALSVSVMLEGWSDDAAPGIGPMGNPLRAGVLDLQARNWADYGPKEGAWRLLDLLDQNGIKAVFYTSGIVAERYPELMREIAGRGHDVAGHSWAQNILPAYLNKEAETDDIARCTQALQAAAGRRPAGWISPRCTPSGNTSTLLAQAGYAWHADIFDRDLPYYMETEGGPLLAMPFTMEVNDMPLYIRYGNEPQAYTHILKRILTQWSQVGAAPICLDLTVHAHVFGRPFGLIELLECLRFAKTLPGQAWLTSHAELGALYRAEP